MDHGVLSFFGRERSFLIDASDLLSFQRFINDILYTSHEYHTTYCMGYVFHITIGTSQGTRHRLMMQEVDNDSYIPSIYK